MQRVLRSRRHQQPIDQRRRWIECGGRTPCRSIRGDRNTGDYRRRRLLRRSREHDQIPVSHRLTDHIGLRRACAAQPQELAAALQRGMDDPRPSGGATRARLRDQSPPLEVNPHVGPSTLPCVCLSRLRTTRLIAFLDLARVGPSPPLRTRATARPTRGARRVKTANRLSRSTNRARDRAA